MARRQAISFLIIVCALVLVPGQVFGQNAAATTAAPAVPAMPKDAKDILKLAAQVNGLGAPGMKPWHLKAAYEVYDVDGKPKYQGTYEEWWAAPGKYKVSFSDPGFHQVEYANGGKLMITGDRTFPLIEGAVEQEITYPMPPAVVLENGEYESQNVTIGAAKLACIQQMFPRMNVNPYGLGLFSYNARDSSSHYHTFQSSLGYTIPLVNLRVCVEKSAPIVRAVVYAGAMLVTFNQVTLVNGHYAAKEFWIKNGDLPLLHVILEDLDGRGHMDDTLFEAPASATPAQLIRVSSAFPGSHYPPHADKTKVHGTVVIEGTLTKKGELRDPHVVSGLAALCPGAMVDAEKLHLPPIKIKDQAMDAVIDIYMLYPER